MKLLPNIAGILLGLAFVIFGLNFFLHFMPLPEDPSPADAPQKVFMAALVPTGYFAFVKVLEILGGAFVAVPRTRNLGLLILGPVIVNILCYHIFLTKGATLADPVTLTIVTLAAFLLWTERAAFARLAIRSSTPSPSTQP